MTARTYDLEVLRALCRRTTEGTPSNIQLALPWHDLRGDGLWIKAPLAMLNRTERAVVEWHPLGDHTTPALPLPFSAGQLAAFMLAGGGLFLHERFAGIDESMEDLQRNASAAFAAMTDALRLWDAARARFDLHPEWCRSKCPPAPELEPGERKALEAALEIRVMHAAVWLLKGGREVALLPAPFTPSATRTHRMAHVGQLDAVIDLARRNAVSQQDWQSVWAALVLLAESPNRPAPLRGYVEGEGVQYRNDDSDEPFSYLSREAFRKRFERAKSKSDASGWTEPDVPGQSRT